MGLILQIWFLFCIFANFDGLSANPKKTIQVSHMTIRFYNFSLFKVVSETCVIFYFLPRASPNLMANLQNMNQSCMIDPTVLH